MAKDLRQAAQQDYLRPFLHVAELATTSGKGAPCVLAVSIDLSG